jgi:hypothetical protein
VAAQLAGGWPELLTPDTLAAVSMETHFGWLWSIRLALLAALLGIAFMRPGQPITEMLIMIVGGAALEPCRRRALFRGLGIAMDSAHDRRCSSSPLRCGMARRPRVALALAAER